MQPRRETKGVVLLIGGLLLALAAVIRSRREQSNRVTLGAVAGVAIALIGLRRIVRSRRARRSHYDARHGSSGWDVPGRDDSGWSGLNWGKRGFVGYGPRSVRAQAERAARDVRRHVHRAVNRAFG